MKELRLAFDLLRMNTWRVILAIVVGSLTLLSALGLAGLSAWLIARTWQKPLVAAITLSMTCVRALGISRAVFRYLDRLASHNVALKGLVNARETIYNHLAAGDPTVVLRMRKGDFLARLGADVDAVGDLIVRGIIPAFVALVLDIVAIVWMSILSPWAGLVMAIALLISGILVPWLSARSYTEAEEARADAEHDLYADVVTVMDHAPELAVAGRLDTVIDSADQAGVRTLEEEDRSAAPNAIASAIGPVATWITVLACLLIGIILYAQNGAGVAFAETTAMQPTTLLMMSLLPLAAFEASDQLPVAAQQFVQSRAALRRLRELLTPPRETGGTPLPSPLPATAPAVQVDHLVAGWDKARPLNNPLTFCLTPGERMVIVGPSGIGKTTLLSTMAGLLPPVQGTALLYGVDVAVAEEKSLRSTVGVFPEDAHIFDTTVLENLQVATGNVTVETATAALQKVGLGEWLDNLPDGINTHLVGGAEAVSGGERRRILLARALLSQRPVVFLDEPTEHMDKVDMRMMMQRILTADDIFTAQQTVVVVTHVLPDNLPEDVQVVAVEPTPERRFLTA